MLHSLGKFLKLDASYLVKGSLWTSLAFLVGTLGSLVTMIAFGNLLSRESYGTYNYLLSLGASLSFLTLSGAGPVVLRYAARGYDHIAPYALRLQLKYNSLAAALVFSVALYYGYKGNFLFASALTLLALAYPIADAFHIYKEILTGRRRFDTLSHITNLITLIGAVATVLVLYFSGNVLILIALYTVMSLVPNVLIYKFVTKEIKTKPTEIEKIEFRHSTLHFTGAGVIGIIASYIDKVILFQVAGPAALAAYTFALAGPDRLKSLLKNTGSVALPNLASRSLEQIRAVVHKRLVLLFVVGIGFTIAYWLAAPILFKLLLPKYLDSINYSRVIAIGLISAPMSVYIGSIFLTQNMLRATYALNFASHLMRIALFAILGWFWHVWGLVIANTLSQFINTLVSIIVWEVEYRRLKLKKDNEPA